MKDLINVVEDGSRALKGTQELEREFGGSAGAKLARRVFVAAPDEWKQLLLAPVTAHTVLAASKFVLKAGTSHGVWRIECVEGETLVCRAISCFRGALGDAEEKLRSFQPREVIPAVVREGRFLGPAGAPKERLLCSPIWDGDRPAQLKQLKEGFKRWGGKPKQQATWEETLGRKQGRQAGKARREGKQGRKEGRERGLAGRGRERGLAGRERGLAGRERGLAGRERGLAGRERGLEGRERGLAGRKRGLTGRERG
ncbi:unnamed protein product [Closterium sp. NIES-64]|nr:unnamed protein product [Closterium sp. NIES-64]